MSNPVKGEVPLVLADGREFILVLDFEALIEAESAYRKPMPLVLAEALQGFVGANRALLFGALRARHPRMTLGDAAALLQSDGETVSEALTAAAEAGFPEASKTEDGDGKNPPGAISGASGAKPGSIRTRSGGRRPKPSS